VADAAPAAAPASASEAARGVRDSSTAQPRVADALADRARTLQRILEVVPGAVTWGLIVLSIGLSFRWPEVVAWFVLTFDVYWLYKAVMLTGSVAAAFTMIRRSVAVDWRARTFGLRDIAGRIADIEARSVAIGALSSFGSVSKKIATE